jgi:hypothetical protein
MKTFDKKIVMPAGGVKMLMQACSVGQAAVYNALSYKSNSEQAKRIRSRAIAEFGGKRINKSVEAVL